MAKVVVQHDIDPGIGIVLEEVVLMTGQTARRGFYGACTECGHPVHRYYQNEAIADARTHVDQHESSL